MLNRFAAIAFVALSSICVATPVSAPDEVSLNPINMPKTNLKFIWMPGQKLVAPAPLDRRENLKDAYGAAFGIDIPIWQYLAGGFYFKGLKGLNLKSPQMTDPDSNPYSFYVTLGLEGFLKPQVEIPFPFGHLAVSIEIPLGISMAMAGSRLGLTELLKPNEGFGVGSDLFGWAFNSGARLGIEYFPTYIFGLFAQAGYEAAYHLFPVDITKAVKTQSPDGSTRTTYEHDRTEYPGYWVHGYSVTAGIKWTY